MTTDPAKDGYCKACGQPLVWTPGRTYHPAVYYIIFCPEALMIPSTAHYEQPAYSNDVPEEFFIEEALV